MAQYDYFSHLRGPDIAGAINAGVNQGRATPSIATSIINGLIGGYQTGQQILESNNRIATGQQQQQINQHIIDRFPVADQQQDAILQQQQNTAAISSNTVDNLDIANKQRQAEADTAAAQATILRNKAAIDEATQKINQENAVAQSNNQKLTIEQQARDIEEKKKLEETKAEFSQTISGAINRGDVDAVNTVFNDPRWAGVESKDPKTAMALYGQAAAMQGLTEEQKKHILNRISPLAAAQLAVREKAVQDKYSYAEAAKLEEHTAKLTADPALKQLYGGSYEGMDQIDFVATDPDGNSTRILFTDKDEKEGKIPEGYDVGDIVPYSKPKALPPGTPAKKVMFEPYTKDGRKIQSLGLLNGDQHGLWNDVKDSYKRTKHHALSQSGLGPDGRPIGMSGPSTPDSPTVRNKRGLPVYPDTRTHIPATSGGSQPQQQQGPSLPQPTGQGVAFNQPPIARPEQQAPEMRDLNSLSLELSKQTHVDQQGARSLLGDAFESGKNRNVFEKINDALLDLVGFDRSNNFSKAQQRFGYSLAPGGSKASALAEEAGKQFAAETLEQYENGSPAEKKNIEQFARENHADLTQDSLQDLYETKAREALGKAYENRRREGIRESHKQGVEDEMLDKVDSKASKLSLSSLNPFSIEEASASPVGIRDIAADVATSQNLSPRDTNDIISRVSRVANHPLLQNATPTVQALAAQESGGRTRAVSPTGVKGLLQVTQAVAGKYNLNRDIPEENVEAGERYINELKRMFKGNEALAFAAYNAGPGTVKYAQKLAADPNEWSSVKLKMHEAISHMIETHRLPRSMDALDKYAEVRNYPEKVLRLKQVFDGYSV